MTVRYGARELTNQRNREVEATTAKIWSTAVTVVWETDPDVIRAVLPPPLEPSEPLARIRFATVDMGTGIPTFGAGWFGVRARHAGTEGEYALFMPMTTEQATIGGRETFGEPKKIGAVSIAVDGDTVSARIDRMGFTLATVTGTLGAPIEVAPKDKVDFYFKCSPSPDGKGFDTEPALVYCRRHEEARDARTIDGTLTLGESPLDPIADIPIGVIRSFEFARVATIQTGEVVERVPADWLLPYVHQRFDDLSVLRKKELIVATGAVSDAPGHDAVGQPERSGSPEEGSSARAEGAGAGMEDARYTIISADAHAGLPCEQYRPYLDARHLPAFDEFLAERQANRDQQMKLNYDYITNWETTHEEGLRGAYDAEQRDKEMDSDGVCAEVIFPDADAITGMESPPFGAGLSAGTIEDPELAFAGARAHNRFLVELCATSPDRRAGIGLVPITHDVDRAVAEIEWLAEHPGIRGIMVPTMWRDHRPYNDPAYDPVWAACQAANFPVHTHSGEAPREEMGDFIGIYLAEVVWWTHRPIAHLLFSGAFERFPGLKVVVTEGASYWVADMKWKWDQYLGGGHTTKKMAALMTGILSKLPSEYFGENIFVGASTMSKEEIRRRHAIGCDVAMWGTDYPHPEGTWPNTIPRLRSDFGDVPVGDTQLMLGGTAARCYGFELGALAPIADRIGPTPRDLGQDVTLVTTPEEIRAAEWWKDEYQVRWGG